MGDETEADGGHRGVGASEVQVSIDSDEVCQAVGRRARELRQELGLTMARFAELAGLSLGMMSKIEHGQTAPSLATLVRIATVAGVPVTSLFRGLDEEHDLVIVRRDQGHEIIHEGSSETRIYQDLGSLRGANRDIEATLITLRSTGEEFPLFQHSGVEFIHLLSGQIEYVYGAKTVLLAKGDTMQIHGEVPHGPVSVQNPPVQFISIKVFPARP